MSDLPINSCEFTIDENGNKYWLDNNCVGLHKDDVPSGEKKSYKDRPLHREDGPAYIGRDGTMKWYQYGLLHREDGPAIEYANGEREYYLYGKKVDESIIPNIHRSQKPN